MFYTGNFMENEDLSPQDRAIGGALIVGGVAAMLSGMGYIFNKLNKKIDKQNETLDNLTNEQKQTIDYALSPNIPLDESFRLSENIISKKDYSSIVIMQSYFRELEMVLTRRLDELLRKNPNSNIQNSGNIKGRVDKILKFEKNPNLSLLIKQYDNFSVYEERNHIIHGNKFNYNLLLPEFHLIKAILTDYRRIYEQIRAEKRNNFKI